MSLATHGYMTSRWQNGAARRRVHARYRARLIRILGWATEGTGGDRYAATTGELACYARGKRIARGLIGMAEAIGRVVS